MNGVADFEELTIGDLFANLPENPTELAANLEPEDFKNVEREARSSPESLPWCELRTALASAILDALDTKLLDAWITAWRKLDEVKEKVEESRRRSSIPVPCALLEHSIHSTLHPYIEVFLGPKSVQRIDFLVTLKEEIEGVTLTFKAGTLVSIAPGKCECSISIEKENGPELFEQQLAKLVLPGKVVLKHPIPMFEEDRPAGRLGIRVEETEFRNRAI